MVSTVVERPRDHLANSEAAEQRMAKAILIELFVLPAKEDTDNIIAEPSATREKLVLPPARDSEP